MKISYEKEVAPVNDAPVFVSNRVLILAINEAIHLLKDEVAKAPDVDRIFKTCFDHKMGPLETADLIGLNTILYSLEVVQTEFRKYRPCILLNKKVSDGHLGMKSGYGLYPYPSKSR